MRRGRTAKQAAHDFPAVRLTSEVVHCSFDGLSNVYVHEIDESTNWLWVQRALSTGSATSRGLKPQFDTQIMEAIVEKYCFDNAKRKRKHQ